MLDANT